MSKKPASLVRIYVRDLAKKANKLGVYFDANKLLNHAESCLNALESKPEFKDEYSRRDLAKFAVSQCVESPHGSIYELSRNDVAMLFLLPLEQYAEMVKKRQESGVYPDTERVDSFPRHDK
jgi:hypothetical protein